MSKVASTILSIFGLLTIGAIIDWSKSDAFTSVVLTLLAIFVALMIHELGHVCGAMVSRSKVLTFAVGPIKVKRMENDQYKWGWVDSWSEVGGYVQIEHHQKKIENAILISVFGGPLASLVLASVYFSPIYFLEIVGVTSFFLFLVTMLPYNATGFFSDGYTMLQILKNNNVFINYYKMTNHLLAKDAPKKWGKELQEEVGMIDAKRLTPTELSIYFIFLFYSAVETRELSHLRQFYHTIDLHQISSQASHQGQLAAIYHYYVATQYLLGEPITITESQLQDLPAFDALSVARTKAILTQNVEAYERYAKHLTHVDQTSYSFLQAEKKFNERYVNV